MRFRSWGALSAFAALAALLVAIPAAGARGNDNNGVDRTGGSKTAAAVGQYIVRLAEAPVVAYDGGVDGYKATAPSKKGEKIDPNSPDVVKYASYLDSRHADVVGKVGGSKFYDYKYSLNGFAAKLTEVQAASLEKTEGVVAVEKDAIGHIETATTPSFLGLTQPGGLWEQLGGKGKAGENVIIGVVDTGIWPEHPSFSDRTGANNKGVGGKLSYQQIPGWHGKCTPGEDFNASNCNQKLIGAQYFNAGFGVDGIADRDFLSPRDYNGHGSHTSSTAGGNSDVAATGAAALFGTISGMAPRARIAMYKVCWEDAGDGGCANSDSVAAIDQAVADGVDVINFSISGAQTNYLDAVEVAFLFAARAGVFVAASAGNGNTATSGPTVAHISPWLTSVAAGTHNRSGTATVTLGNGAVYTGASLTDAVGPAQLVKSTSVGKAGADATEVALCFIGTLDPAKAAGKIVQCDRGVNARVDKSAAVKEAGGVGMVMTNTSANSLNADLHTVPTVHLADTDRAAILAYIDSAGASATATLSKAVVNNSAPAPDIAAFSSRGPNRAGGDILKPDVMAPGVDVLAAVAPPGNHDKLFDLLSGTSMSSPHVAGLAALLRQAHPDWSPMAIKSALMTTASATAPITAAARSPFASGAGQVVPTSANNPGLVYDAGFGDWLSFLKGLGLIGNNVPAIDASNLNQASIAVGDLAGAQTITRTVRSVGSASETYTGVVTLAGFDIALSPSSFTIAPGATQSYTLGLTRTTATLNAYAVGSVRWTGDKGHVVTSRLVIQPVSLAAPLKISGTGASGTVTYPVTFGYTGSSGTSVRGLTAAQTFAATVVDDPTSNFNTAKPTQNQGITTHDVAVPAGTTYARFSLFDDFTDGADDLDMYVYRIDPDGSDEGTDPDLVLVGSSGSGTSAEEVNLINPAAATYKVFVHGWETDGPDANYTLFAWTLGSTAAGNLTATPSTTTATTGASANVVLAWTGLDATKKYLGAVDYTGSTGMPTTIVRIG